MIPYAARIAQLEHILNQVITIRLYSNEVILTPSKSAGDFTEVIGGGYVSKLIAPADWTVAQDGATVAGEGVELEWVFTGVTNTPATIYGYYYTDENNALLGAEGFSALVEPISGTKIRITPRYVAG